MTDLNSSQILFNKQKKILLISANLIWLIKELRPKPTGWFPSLLYYTYKNLVQNMYCRNVIWSKIYLSKLMNDEIDEWRSCRQPPRGGPRKLSRQLKQMSKPRECSRGGKRMGPRPRKQKNPNERAILQSI